MSLVTTTEVGSVKVLPSYKSKYGFVNVYFVLIFLSLNTIFLWNIELDTIVRLSFLLNLVFLSFAILSTISKSEARIVDSVMIAFIYAFLWLAPLFQLDLGRFPYFTESRSELIVPTNLIILVFLVSYFVFKTIFSVWSSGSSAANHLNSVRNSKADKSVFTVYVVISIVLLLLYFPTLISYLTSRVGLIDFSAEGQFVRKFVFYIPLFPLYFLLITNKKKLNYGSVLWVILLFFCAAVFFLFKNPFNEKRNAIGPLYLSIISIMLANRRITSNRMYIGFMIFVLVFMFPVFSVITHSGTALAGSTELFVERIAENSLQKSLSTGDFDSWSMILSTYDYCKENGFTYGNQLVGNMLFFVPRTLWPLKSYGSGAYIVNNYLWKAYGWNFANVSCPLPAEGYINFGIIGTILFALGLSILGIISDKCLKSEDVLKKIFAYFVPFQLVMLLRGDLNSGFAYLITPLLAIYFLPKLLRGIFYRLQFRH